MPQRKVLLLGNPDQSPQALSALLERDSESGVATEVVGMIGEALERVSAESYDAVVCWAERLHELVGVIRIRKANPKLPIVVVTSHEDSSFETLARQMGATRVLGEGAGLSSVSETLKAALSTDELAREVGAHAAGIRSRARKVRDLVRVNKKLSEESLALIRKGVRRPLLPLLVEADPDQALLTVRAFQKAGVHVRLPLMRSGEEVVRYLSGAAPFQNRARFPLPTLVLLDVQLPGMSGLEVLDWIKGQASLRALRVVLLSSAPEAAALNRAHAAGADGFLTKPTTLEGLEALAALVGGAQSCWGWVPPPGKK